MTLISQFQSCDRDFCAANIRRSNVTIDTESPVDFMARERLLNEVFGATRFDKTVERLRAGRLPAEGLALTAKDGSFLVGTLRLWHVQAGALPALLLGPLAVTKTLRRQGVGRRLMEEALFRAAAAGHAAILLVGDGAYYKPFGFSRRHTRSLSLPGPVEHARFLGLELMPGAFEKAKGRVSASGTLDVSIRRDESAFCRAA